MVAMKATRPIAVIASLAIVAGLGAVVVTHTTVRAPLPGENVVYFKLTCSEGQPGVHTSKYWIYGPSWCQPVMIIYD